jgi:hypothetical protein
MTASSKSQKPNPKLQDPKRLLAFGDWYFFGIWFLVFGISLMFGAWDLELSR